MAQPTTLRFGKCKILIGDGATPEVFSAPCGFTEFSFARNKSLNEVVIPDCDDPDAPAWVATDVASLSYSGSGSGVLNAESVALWDAFFDSVTSKNIKIVEEFAAPTGTITYSGKMHLDSYEIKNTLGNRVNASISLRSDGALTRSPAV